MATLRLSSGCHLTERSWMEEVATRLPADRPLLDDNLFVDQSEMIYSMDSRSFYRESFSNLTGPRPRRPRYALRR
ncbi:unnamed protein product [Spirodela intermedia]|uniref:Uncharacterized protein n=1 Tax=Spirodela intermedia TaxID=51605 RepID=A0A7I8L6K4_SPIIN|nr:unnamed protein product [Spirodela intermedia]